MGDGIVETRFEPVEDVEGQRGAKGQTEDLSLMLGMDRCERACEVRQSLDNFNGSMAQDIMKRLDASTTLLIANVSFRQCLGHACLLLLPG